MKYYTLMDLKTTSGMLKFLRLDGKISSSDGRSTIDKSILPYISMEGQLIDMMKDKEHFKPFFNDEMIQDELDFNIQEEALGRVDEDRWAELLFDLMVYHRLPTYPKPFQVNRNNRMLNGIKVEYRDPRDIADGLPQSQIRRWETDGAIANIIGEIPFFSDPREWMYLRRSNYGDKKLNFDKTFRHMLDNGVWVLPEFDAHYDIWKGDERFVGPIFNDVGPFPQQVTLIENDVDVVRNVEVVFIQGWVKVPYVANATHSKRYGYDFKLEKLDEKILSISEMVAVDYDTGEYLGFIDDIMNYTSGSDAYVKFQDHPYGFPFMFLTSNYYDNQTPQVSFNRRMSGNYWGFPHFGYRKFNYAGDSLKFSFEMSRSEGFNYELNSFPLINDVTVSNLMYGYKPGSLSLMGNTFTHYLSVPNGARNDNEVIQTNEYIPMANIDDFSITGEVIPEYRPEGSITNNFKYTKAEIQFWEGNMAETFLYDGTSSPEETYEISHGLKNPSSLINRMHPALHSNKYNPYRFMDGYQGSSIDNYIPEGVNPPKYNQWRIDSMDFMVENSLSIEPLPRFFPLPYERNKMRLNGSYVHALVHAKDYQGEFTLVEIHFNERYDEPIVRLSYLGTNSEVNHHAPFPDNYNYDRESEVFEMFNPRIATRGITLYHMDKDETQKLFLSFWEMTWDDWKDFFLSKSTDGILGLKWYYGLYGENVTTITQEGGFTGVPEPIKIGNKTLTHKPITFQDNIHPMGTVLDYEFIQMTFNPFTVPIPYENSAGGSPHSSIDLYLPFYGYYKLDVDSVAGERLFVKYVISLFTGIASIRIYQVDSNFDGGDEIELRDHALIDVVQAEMSVDIPIDAQANENFAMKVANSLIQKPINAAGPGGLIMSSGEALITPSRVDVTRTGGLNPEFSILAPLELRLLVTSPKQVYSNQDVNGIPQYIYGSLSGYEEGDYVKFSGFKDLDSSGNHKYSEEIIELLKGGVYL